MTLLEKYREKYDEGKVEGKAEGKAEVIFCMLDKGKTPEEVAALTDISVEEILKIKEEALVVT